MNRNNILFLLSCICFGTIACSSIQPISTPTPIPTITPTQTLTPTITPVPINPVNKIVQYDANSEIMLTWFSYIPSGLDKTKPVYILVTGLHGQMGTYAEQTLTTKIMLSERLNWPNFKNFILVAPVIPRINNSAGEIYSVAFDLNSFKSSNNFAKRADLKLNQIIDRFSEMLRKDGFIVNDKILIEGFSAGAMFAQRYSILQPDRVLAIAAGQCGGNFTLPLSSYEGTSINWPVGINNLESLAKIIFNESAYKNIFQLIYIGDQDSKEGNSIIFPNKWGATNMWQSVSQRDFLRKMFGAEDPVRMKNQIEFLNGIGFNNILIKIYPGIGHQETFDMIKDKMDFFLSVINNLRGDQ